MPKLFSKIKIDTSAIFLVIILCVLVVTGLFLIDSLKTDIVAESFDSDSLIKVLFIFEDGGRALFTDVFFYYPPLKRGAVFAIPGNTGAIYRSLGQVDRIDSVYNELGVNAYRTEIENLLDQRIPFTVVISLDSLCRLTDILGGLRAFVPFPVDAVGPNGERWLLPSGAITLDGDKIRSYVTYALPEETADDRQEREQSVMISLLNAVNEHRRLFAGENFRELFPLFSSNLEEKDLSRLFSEISNVDTDRMVPQSIIGTQRTTSDGKALLFPHSDGQLIKEVLKQTAGALVSLDETQYSRIYALEIQNGTTVQGLARNTSILLQSIGYNVLSMVNAPANDVEKTVIINHIGNDQAAKNLGDFLRCENIIVPDVLPDARGSDADSSQFDFTIILGKDFDGRYVH